MACCPFTKLSCRCTLNAQIADGPIHHVQWSQTRPATLFVLSQGGHVGSVDIISQTYTLISDTHSNATHFQVSTRLFCWFSTLNQNDWEMYLRNVLLCYLRNVPLRRWWQTVSLVGIASNSWSLRMKTTTLSAVFCNLALLGRHAMNTAKYARHYTCHV